MIGEYAGKLSAAAIRQHVSKVDHDGVKFYYFSSGEYRAVVYHDHEQHVDACDTGDACAVSSGLLAGYVGERLKRLDLHRVLEGFPEIDISECLTRVEPNFRMILLQKHAGKGPHLYLCSNRVGPRRIYYAEWKSGIVFSSKIDLLLALLDLKKADIDNRAIFSILQYGAVPEPLTISRRIKVVPSAHYIKFSLTDGHISTRPYFRLHFNYSVKEADIEEALVSSENALKESAQLLKSLDASIMLSGGVDSSLFVNYMRGGRKTRVYALGFDSGFSEENFSKVAAERADANLQVHKMRDNHVLSTLVDAANLTDHPFSDYSSLPIVFLLKQIARTSTERLLIDGNGGDDCFGFSGLLRSTELKWKLISHLYPAPAFVRQIAWQHSVTEGDTSQSQIGTKFLRVVLNSGVKLEVLPLLSVPKVPQSIFQEPIEKWDTVLQSYLMRFLNSFLDNWNRSGFYEKITAAQLSHVCSRLWCAKAMSPAEELGITVVYPFTWQRVLIQQGKLSREVKVRNGKVKWPLKHLLEEFMPQEFIYRKKQGFNPPLVHWLTCKEINRYVRGILLSRNAILLTIVKKDFIDRLLGKALQGALKSGLEKFIWGAVFTELWIQKHWGD